MAVKDRSLLFSAIPYPDESFVGYLLRLTERNHYETLSWILQLAEIKNYAHSNYSFALSSSLTVTPLAQLTGVDEPKLAALLYAPIRISRERMMGDFSIFGASVPHYIIRLRTPKVCPACLRETGYIRKIWELAPVTACPLHECLLIDECPGCKKTISWNRKEISRCRCGVDWRKVEPILIAHKELLITRQIHFLCKLSYGMSSEIPLLYLEHLKELELRFLTSALILIGSQYVGVIDTKGKHLLPRRRNKELHELFCKALLVFEDWPKNFFPFLDFCRAQKYPVIKADGIEQGLPIRSMSNRILYSRVVRKEFTEFSTALYNQLLGSQFDFIRRAFDEYFEIRERERVISIARQNSEGRSLAANDSEFVSVREAKKLLKMAFEDVDQLISSGKLKAIIVPRQYKREILVDKKCLEELKSKFEQSLFLKQVGPLLGLPFDRVKQLSECGLLPLVRGQNIDGFARWKFDGAEVYSLIDRLIALRPRKLKSGSSNGLSFKMVSRKVGQFGISLGTFVQDILNGQIQPFGIGKGGYLGGLFFSNHQVINYISNHVGDVLSLSEVSGILGVSLDTVYFFIEKQILCVAMLESTPTVARVIRRKDLDLFNATYFIASKFASICGTSSEFIVRMLATRGAHPVSGPKVDAGQTYIFRRRDVEEIDLAALIAEGKAISKARDAASKRTSSIIDEARAANILGLDVREIQRLAENGVLKPLKKKLAEKAEKKKYRFSRYTIEKYKCRSADHSDLISFTTAAMLFDLRPDPFCRRYIVTGRIKPVLEGSKRSTHYFQLEDVERLLEIKKKTVSSREAAEILKVNVSTVGKMVKSGILTPISGRSVDGYGINRYLRDDIENLHSERTLFKAKCIKEGKTFRFGRRAGPTQRPVQSKVGPRIDELVEDWKINIPARQVSGIQILQQLKKDGFQVGINTVYVYLREHHRQSV